MLGATLATLCPDSQTATYRAIVAQRCLQGFKGRVNRPLQILDSAASNHQAGEAPLCKADACMPQVINALKQTNVDTWTETSFYALDRCRSDPTAIYTYHISWSIRTAAQ